MRSGFSICEWFNSFIQIIWLNDNWVAGDLLLAAAHRIPDTMVWASRFVHPQAFLKRIYLAKAEEMFCAYFHIFIGL